MLEVEYHERRVIAERIAAAGAKSAVARRLHHELANRHNQQVRSLLGSFEQPSIGQSRPTEP